MENNKLLNDILKEENKNIFLKIEFIINILDNFNDGVEMKNLLNHKVNNLMNLQNELLNIYNQLLELIQLNNKELEKLISMYKLLKKDINNKNNKNNN